MRQQQTIRRWTGGRRVLLNSATFGRHSMNYELVFDGAQSGSRNWAFAASGLLFVCIGAFLVKNRRNRPAMFPGWMGPKAASVFAYVFLVFSMLWTTVAFTATVRDYSKV